MRQTNNLCAEVGRKRVPIFAALAALALPIAPAVAKPPPNPVVVYIGCVERNFSSPSEKSDGFDAAVELAKSYCGNLHPAAVTTIRNNRDSIYNGIADHPGIIEEEYLDILVKKHLRADRNMRSQGIRNPCSK